MLHDLSLRLIQGLFYRLEELGIASEHLQLVAERTDDFVFTGVSVFHFPLLYCFVCPGEVSVRQLIHGFNLILYHGGDN